VVLVGEGVVRFALLTLSRQRGEKEWMRVIASTYSDHVVLCGLGHLGYRVLEQLLALGADVVSVERDATCRFLSLAKATGAPVLVRDMRDDEVLEEAGVARARTIVLATNDDMANLEAALDARRFNPRIRVVMRLFDQQLAAKVAGAFNLGAVFSASALAAPAVAVMAQASRVLASYSVAGAAHVVGELKVEERSSLVGRSTAELEQAHQARVVARNGASATDAPVAGGDVLVVHAAAAAWPALAEAARAS
jgi:Trk K+ transport system NAD-binding subunit